jgi:2,3-bisphosphoglycerate-independent phosphoglycerate mutase
VVLCILDGVGLGTGEEDDAVATAPTPTLDRLRARFPTAALAAHGTAVGLPSDNDMGNSEVGHNALGAGRIFDQGAKLVNHGLASGEAYATDVWGKLIAGKTLHFMGLLSDGNVHSHVDHLHAMITRAVADGVKRIRVHVLTDGRDVAARSALTWVPALEAALADLRQRGIDAWVAGGGGRMHMTMDRYEADWPMVQRGWDCHVHGHGSPHASATEAIEHLYAADPEVDDQYLPAFVVVDEDGTPRGTIEDGDSVLFFNFRGDRAIEISRAFEDDDFPHFDRGARPQVFYAGMMQYDGDAMVPSSYLVQPPAIDGTVGDVLAAHDLRTFAVAETQKFGHVTYFFNGNRSGYLDAERERYVEIPSDVRPFDETPWMKAAEVTDAAIAAIESGEYDHVRLNLANGDMVGHTGNLDATRVALSCVDIQLARLERATRAAGGVLLVTADHGNADEMYMRKGSRVLTDEQGSPKPRTSHSLAPVPFIVCDPSGAWTLADADGQSIAAIAASLLTLLDVPVPSGWLPSLVRPRAASDAASSVSG